MRPVVVGVDGSQASLVALDWAAEEAALHEVPLRVVHVAPAFCQGAFVACSPGPTCEAKLGGRLVREARARVRQSHPTMPVHTDVAEDSPTAVGLLRFAQDSLAVVVGHDRRSAIGGILFGAVGPSVVARSTCPVIVVRGTSLNISGGNHRVMLWESAADQGPRTTAFAFQEAEVRRVENVYVSSGANVRKGLAEATAESDLVVVGVRPRRSALGRQLEPICRSTLYHASCPVAFVPETS
jgi:nucleotide-binding universal stress UspA family protein